MEIPFIDVETERPQGRELFINSLFTSILYHLYIIIKLHQLHHFSLSSAKGMKACHVTAGLPLLGPAVMGKTGAWLGRTACGGNSDADCKD
ncbi:MAG: hypothetical protein L7W95_04075 [Alphaproteobacteria bacterium]|nr:hypothetical protein [Alphaproteobacteria bacterium]